MISDTIRFQLNPTINDTVGFYDRFVPSNNEYQRSVNKDLLKYYKLDLLTPITDSIYTPKQEVISIFSHHTLKTHNLDNKPAIKQSNDWIIILIFFCMLFFAWIQTMYRNRLGQILKAVVQPYYINQLEREGNLLSERITLGLYFIYFGTLSLFFYLSAVRFNIVPVETNKHMVILLLFVGIFLYTFLQNIFVYLLGVIFHTEESSHNIRLILMIFNQTIGVLLLPITIVGLFWDHKIIIIIGLITLSILLIYRFIRFFLVEISNKRYNLFYLILYLCTLEVLPIILIAKILSNY